MSKTPSLKLQTRNELKEGETYTFEFFEQGENYLKEKIKKKVRLLKKYRHFALFEYESGIRESFDYWTIRKMLNGEAIER